MVTYSATSTEREVKLKHIHTLSNYLRKAILYSCIATIFLISLYGCGASNDSGAPTATPSLPTVTVPVTAGAVTTPLPSNIPLQQPSQLLQEYAGNLNGASATVWVYAEVGPSASSSGVTDYYKTNMPSNGWTSIDVPIQIPQGQSGLAFRQGGQTCVISVGASTSQPGGVVLTITLAG